jgi:ribosomal protein L30E
MDIKQQTQNVANQGRYGDSMLLHVNPAEVKGLAQAMPITVNPETGQPEAFLPFLAPLLGSALGTTFLTGLGGAGVVGAGISSALAAGLGAGAATYLQSGGSGSKALLSGLTAGFGTSAANTAAQTAQTGSDIAAGVAGGMSPELAAQTAAAATPRAATGAFQSGKDLFMQGSGGGAGGTFAFDQGAKSLANAAMTPSGMMAGTALGGSSIINSQELYEQQMRQFEEDEKKRRRDMYANNPEVQLYSASGGTTGFNEGGFVSSVRNLADRLSDNQFGYESSRQVYAPAKTQYQVNPDFMAGFAPETMYFRPNTINSPSMSTLGGSRPTLGADTYTGTKGGYDYEGSVDAGGNYTAGTAQGVQFAPQTSIDPYAAFTGSAPQGLVQSAYNPYPVQPMSMSPIDDTSDYTDAGGIGEDGNEGGGNSGGGGGLYDGDQGYFNDINFMGGDMSGFDPYFSQFVTKKDLPSMIPQVPNDSNFSIENLNLPDFSQFVTQQDLLAFNPQDYKDDFLSIAKEGIEMPSYEQPDLSSFAKLSDIPSFDPSSLQDRLNTLEGRQSPVFNPQDYRDDFLSIAREGINIPSYEQPDLSSFAKLSDIPILVVYNNK